MDQRIDYEELQAALGSCGSTWDVAQAHGLLCARLAVEGADAGRDWLLQVLDGVRPDDPLRDECESFLDALYGSSYRQLVERQSEFVPLLPDDGAPAAARAEALAGWCEGFLHGLVTGRRDESLRERLGQEPLADVIRDLLQITRAAADDEEGSETDEKAYAEVVEYVRVAVQLTYEELAPVRAADDDRQGAVDPLH
ncbi:MAG: UPF0149 family protein [Woeseiaceae bacterium]|nr:UPF0149 family protein [Woeseiaceae bacterium]